MTGGRLSAPFSLRSVRMRLTLWSVGVLALTLGVMGTAFHLRLEYAGTAEVDRTLASAAHSVQEMASRVPPDDHRDGPPPPNDANQRPPNEHRPHPGGGPLGAFRPRILDLSGQVLMGPPEERNRPMAPWDRGSFAQSAQGAEVASTITADGEPLRVLSVPLRRSGVLIGVAQLAQSLAPLQEEVARLTRTLLTLIPLALLIAGLGGAFLTERALHPVRALGQAAGRIEASDLSRRLPAGGGDEFAALAETFNAMLARLEGAFLSLEAAYEQQRQFTADASHELRTPLTIIKANTSLALLTGRTAADFRQALEAADTGADRTIRLVQDLLLLARADAGQETPRREAVSLAPLLADAGEAARAGRTGPQAALQTDLPAREIRLQGDPDSLRRLLTNLLENALRHTPPHGTVCVSAAERDGFSQITIADTGEGIEAKHLPHLFDRFYRADAARTGATGGTGLGLAICRSIAEAHGGTIALESTLGQGTTVTVTLPTADAKTSGLPSRR